jgi:hypothetical protein
MTVDSEFIQAANNRLQWDGIWKVKCIFPGPVSVHEALDRAIIALFEKTGGSKPQLILCSWAAGRRLLLEAREREPQGHFENASAYDREAMKRAFQWDHEGSRGHLFERGYLGTYAGAVVIASIYLGVWESDYAIVSSVLQPKEVEYDGSNCVLVQFGVGG